MRTTKILIIALFCFMTAACSWFEDIQTAPDIPEQDLYQEAMSAMDNENFDIAIEKLQLLEARYPFGRFSEQAQLELIYAYFSSYEPEAARAAADRFIRLHPNHDNIDYAYYLKGLTAFEQDISWITQYLPIDETQRDPGAALDSFESFATLVSRYPESQYAPDSQKRMVYLKNRLAAYEVHVARYYIQREAFVAAANRGRYVIENMQETPAVPDALAVMIEAYTHLGQQDLAADTQSVLAKNFPSYQYSPIFKGEKTLLDAATFDLFSDTKEAPIASPVRMSQEAPKPERSIFSTVTFGVFDDDEKQNAE
ncbi:MULTISPECIES: outer membrane protein assembly factor BamD [unclassified Neptuniibacter]|uniref:outer membrane protein assembly factor BamD n=1 Tax=unclassified Neptuniibacter TaxID=2630693 RepID=UPI000C685A67|nr:MULTISPECIES: outer membrane protein assembly factor BamD [unclassified Neptuniibacter]MAY42811.1 outer membrane protein assembly factor BamD [Oceanospirillaceae bacterium]|tara:strand:+ start:3441 stop:4373 length:933 start_codon:yes stop_codon:yes gene_type:complete